MTRTMGAEIQELYGKQLQREAEAIWAEIEADCLDWELCPRCHDLMERGWDLIGQAVFYGVDDYSVADEWEFV